MIGNISSHIGVLISDGKNDSQTPVEQGLLLQQRLTEVDRPDHLIITYPNLGHQFNPSNEWYTQSCPVKDTVLLDLYEWLAAHSGLSHSYATSSAASTMETSTSSLNTNKTS